MTTGNYLVDILGMEAPTPTPTPTQNGGEAPYLQDIQNVTQPAGAVGQETDYQKWGLNSQEELDLMNYVKNTGGSADDFTEVLTDYRGQTEPDQPAPLVEEEEKIEGLDIGVKAGEAISETAKKFKFQSNVDDGIIESGLKFLGNLPANTVQIAGDLIEVASNPVGTVKSVLDLGQGLSDKLVFGTLNKVFGQDVPDTEKAVVIDAITEEVKKLGEPGRVKELLVENPGDVLLTAMGGLGVAKSVAKSKGMTDLANKLDKVQDLTNPIKIQAEAAKGVGAGVSKAKSKLFPEKGLDDIVLEVSQGKTKNIPAVKETLGQLDTTDVKTYKDLNRTLGDKVTEIARKQDELLPKEAVLKLDDLTTTKGKRTTNFINEALDDLENVGNKENDLVLLNRVDDIRDKGDLSVKDINDLARFYGSEFKQKSFTAAGEPKSSLSASRFENIRKGLKTKSRELLPDDTVKLLDDELSKLFETKQLTEKMADNVVNLQKKISQRGLLENVARGMGKAVDIATLGTARGFLTSFLPSNIGNKVLNSIAIEGNLTKNLKRLQELNKKVDKLSDTELEEAAKKEFSDLLKERGLEVEAISNLEDNK